MPVEQERSRAILARSSRQLAKLAKHPNPRNIHKFRTNGRRVEAVLQELSAKSGGNSRKLEKLLSRLRRKAGQVRDLDVQISALRNLKIPESARQKSQILQALTDERAAKEKKIAQLFDKTAVRELRRRLKKAAAEIQVSEGDALRGCLRLMAKLEHDSQPISEAVLHRYRVLGKRARYLAELADKSDQAEKLVARLRLMQDVIGDWHDWLKLSQRAQEILGPSDGSPLISVLSNVTRAKFRQAVDALAETRAALVNQKSAVPKEGPRKEASGVQKTAVAA
jgi:CHAD domain-containing protein